MLFISSSAKSRQLLEFQPVEFVVFIMIEFYFPSWLVSFLRMCPISGIRYAMGGIAYAAQCFFERRYLEQLLLLQQSNVLCDCNADNEALALACIVFRAHSDCATNPVFEPHLGSPKDSPPAQFIQL